MTSFFVFLYTFIVYCSSIGGIGLMWAKIFKYEHDKFPIVFVATLLTCGLIRFIVEYSHKIFSEYRFTQFLRMDPGLPLGSEVMHTYMLSSAGPRSIYEFDEAKIGFQKNSFICRSERAFKHIRNICSGLNPNFKSVNIYL